MNKKERDSILKSAPIKRGYIGSMKFVAFFTETGWYVFCPAYPKTLEGPYTKRKAKLRATRLAIEASTD